MTNHTATDTPPLMPAVGAQVERGVRPWGWHAGDGTPAHPAERVAQWPAHNRERMRYAVYAEADTLALADQVLTLNNALRDAERQRDAVQAALLEAMRVVAKVDPRGAAKWLRERG